MGSGHDTVTINPHNAGKSESGATLTSRGERKGRPPRYSNCLDLAWDIECYFEECDEGELITKHDKGKPYEVRQKIPYMITGLPVYVGMTKDNFWGMAARSEHFQSVLQNARDRIELQRGKQLLTSESNTIGSIFLLKAYHGLRDTPEQAQSSGITVIIEGSGSVKLSASQVQEAIDCDYQTVSVALPASQQASHANDD